MILIDITENNIRNYIDFEKCYIDKLSQFLSRIYPDSDTVIKWCYINVDGKNIGSIWLETVDIDTAKLGVFIANEEYRNNGYGSKAIENLLCFAKDKGYKNVILNVRTNNIRAYTLYKKLGFVQIKKYTKENGIEVFLMKLELWKDYFQNEGR